jgi:hypothetical protein
MKGKILKVCPMNAPAKHHFIPAFSLKPWVGSDGLVCEIRRVGVQIISKRKHPNATGYERHLYRTEGVPEAQAQHLEENFLKPIDTEANLALQKMLSGVGRGWTSKERSRWARYILSLMFRGPETVHDLKRHMAAIWDQGLSNVGEVYQSWRTEDDPETFEAFVDGTDLAAPHAAATNMLVQLIDNDRVGPAIFAMDWSVLDLSGSSVSLLISDRPLDRPVGLGNPRAYIALPISPTKVFLATRDRKMVDWVEAQSHSNLAKGLNRVVVGQACEFVWCKDERQLPFVRKHFGTRPLRPMITDEQRQRAIDAGNREVIGRLL